MKFKRIVSAALLVIAVMLTVTACPGDDKPIVPNTPAPELPDGEEDCDLGDIAEFDSDCFPQS
jgi:hypothetical protein